MPDPHNTASPTPEQRFAQLVRERREANGWSQEELARRVSAATGSPFHQTAVTRLESGSRNIRLNEVVALAEVLYIDLGPLAQKMNDQNETERNVLFTLEHARATLMEQNDLAFKLREDMENLSTRYAKALNQIADTQDHIQHLNAILEGLRDQRDEDGQR